MDIFEKYYNLQRDYCQVSNQISTLISEWVKEHIGFVTDDTNNYVGLTRPGEYSWSLLGNNKVQISYAVYEDKYGDYWSDDKYVTVEYDELLKYNVI